MSVALETVDRCDLCGGTAFRLRHQWKDQLLFGPERWRVVQCERCSLCFVNPRPARDEIGRFYPQDYSAHVASPARVKRWHRRVSARDARGLRWWERPLIQIRQDVSWYRMPRWHGDGRVLDVGCGSGGRYLGVLKELGWKTHGIEPSEHAVRAAIANGHDAVVGTAEERRFDAGSMDLVTIWHVLEHTHSPRAALRACFETLRPGGVLSLCVPNYHSLQAAMFGRFWWSCDAPRHLFQFTRRTLRQYLEEVGFRLVDVTTRTGSTSWQRAAHHLINAAFGTRWVDDSKWAVELGEPLVRLFSLVRFFGIGAELRVIAERPA